MIRSVGGAALFLAALASLAACDSGGDDAYREAHTFVDADPIPGSACPGAGFGKLQQAVMAIPDVTAAKFRLGCGGIDVDTSLTPAPDTAARLRSICDTAEFYGALQLKVVTVRAADNGITAAGDDGRPCAIER